MNNKSNNNIEIKGRLKEQHGNKYVKVIKYIAMTIAIFLIVILALEIWSNHEYKLYQRILYSSFTVIAPLIFVSIRFIKSEKYGYDSIGKKIFNVVRLLIAVAVFLVIATFK